MSSIPSPQALGRAFRKSAGWMIACHLLCAFVLIRPAQGAPSNPELRQELLNMGKADQEIRKKIFQSGGGTPDPALIQEMLNLDKTNTTRLKQIIEMEGWPSAQTVGKDAVHSAFLIVQHAVHDRAFQRDTLPLIEKSVKAGDLKSNEFALLTDRILVGEGKSQIYGTQARIIDGKLKFDPIKDEANLSARRRKLGLIPFKEYEQRLRKTYSLDPPAQPTKP